MKSILSTFISIISVMALVACGNGSQSEESTQQGNDTIQQLDSATIVKKQQEEAKTRDTLPQNCSADQAINYMKTSGYWNKYSTGVIPSFVRQHLPYAQRLINNKYKHFIIVDKGSMQVLLYDKYGHLKLNYKMACGRNYGHKRGKADCRTPEGIFSCGGWYDSTDWLYTNDWGVTSRARGQFGPRFIRVCPQIGIHGTAARYSIGRRCSHGCIRIQNENVLELVKYVETGMPIIVNPGPYDVAANKKNGVNSPVLEIPNLPGEAPKPVVLDNKDKAKTNTKTNKNASKADNKKEANKTTKPSTSNNTATESKSQEAPTTNVETPINETPKTETPAVAPKVETPAPAPKPDTKPEPTTPATPITE